MRIKKYIIFFILILSQISLAQQDDGTSFIYAKKLMNDSLFDLAAEQFHLFAEENPLHANAPQALFYAGKCYYQNRQYDEAIKEFTLLISQFPDAKVLDQAHFELAKSFNAKGNFNAAAKTFHQVYIFFPKSKLAKTALLKSAEKFFEIKNYEQAKRISYDLQEAFPNSSESFAARLILIDIFLDTKHFKHAETDILNLLSLTETGFTHAKALLRKGFLEKFTGRNEDAEQSFRSLIEKYETKRGKKDWDNVLDRAAFELASLLYQKKMNAQAIEILEKNQTNHRNPKELFLFAQVLIEEKKYDQAVNILSSLAQNDSDSLSYIKANYLQGVAFSELEDFYQANLALKNVIDFCRKNSIRTDCFSKSYARLSKNYLKSGKFEAAIKLLNDYSFENPEDGRLDRVFFKIAKIYQEELKDFERAIRNFDEILLNFPKSELVDDAQFAIAQSYELKKDYRVAQEEYERLIYRFPASPFKKSAEAAIFRIKTFTIADSNLKNSIDHVVENIVNEDGSKQPDLEEIGHLYFSELKNYDKAISYWKKLLVTDELSEDGKAKTYYFIGKSYFLSAQRDANTIDASKIDSARNYFARVLNSYSSSEWADDAAFSNIEIYGKNTHFDDQTFKQLCTNFLIRYPDSPHAVAIHKHFARLVLKQPNLNSLDSLDITNSLNFLRNHSESAFDSSIVKYMQAALFARMKNDSAAINLLAELAGNKSNPEPCKTIDLLADISLRNNLKEFEKTLSTFAENHFYSPCVPQIKIKLGKIYLDQGQAREAEAIFKGLYHQMINGSFFDEGNVQNNCSLETVIFQLGKTYQSLKQRGKAIQFFQKYLQLFPKGKYSEETIFSLGHLFSDRQLEDKRKAIDYFKRFISDFPQSPLADSATVKIGDIFLELKDYNQASNFYLKIIPKPETSVDKAYVEAQNIICQIKKGKIDSKLTFIAAFKKKYGKKHPLVADLMLEAGANFLKAKNFKQAEKIFKDVKSSYKKTYQGARAEFLLGRLYFILNKDEDGLKILIKLIEKYPDQEKIVADAYIALGNFYYLQAKQVQNALFAYQKVTQLKNTTADQEKLAKNNIIRCYTDMRMREQAIAAIHDYVDQYPDSEDIFEKKVSLGILFYELHEYDRALAMLKKLKYEADIENEPRIQYWIGECYAGKGDFKRAVSEYLKISYLSRPTKLNWGVTAQFQAGVAYMKAGEPENAKKIFEKIVRQQGKTTVFGKPAQQKIEELDRLIKQK